MDNKQLMWGGVIVAVAIIAVMAFGNSSDNESAVAQNEDETSESEAMEEEGVNEEAEASEAMEEEVGEKPVSKPIPKPTPKVEVIPFEEPEEFGELDSLFDGLDGLGEGIDYSESDMGNSLIQI